jgi:hypothetical protein
MHTPHTLRGLLDRALALPRALLAAFVLLAPATARLDAAGAVIDQSNIQVTYHVKTAANGGNNAHSGLTANAALATVRAAVNKAQAAGGPLQTGKKTRIYVYEGTYTDTARIEVTNVSNTLLIIEGQTKGKVILTYPPNNQENTSVLKVDQRRQNVVLRKLTLRAQTASGKLYSGFSIGVTNQLPGGGFENTYEPKPITNGRNWLIEDCDFSGNDKHGAEIFHVDNITFRNNTSSNNGGTGVWWIGTGGDFYNLVSNNNNGRGVSTYSGGGYAIFARDSVFTNLTGNANNTAAGFRQDHVATNLILKNSEFRGNKGGAVERKGHGVIFETAAGPVYLQNVTSVENDYVGLELATAHGVSISQGTKLQNNRVAQLKITAKVRTQNIGDEKMAGDFTQRWWVGKTPLEWVKNTRMVDSTLSTNQGATSYLIQGAPGETHGHASIGGSGYRHWYQSQYVGLRNSFSNPANANSFEVGESLVSGSRVFTNLAGWRSATGTETP